MAASPSPRGTPAIDARSARRSGPAPVDASRLLWPGARIANGRGVPGTLGGLAIRRHDGLPVLLTSHHVLFGSGAGAGEPVWLACGAGTEQTIRRIGSSFYGRLGSVDHEGVRHHVDCAVAALDPPFDLPPFWVVETEPPHVAQAGTIVTSPGGSTGVVVGAERLLVRSIEAGPFSAPGDSGAVVRDESGAAIGLVEGIAPSGETIVSPIGAVLHVLAVRLLRPPPLGRRA